MRGKVASISSKWRTRTLHSEVGFTVVEVLTTVAIAGVITLGISTFVSDMFTMQKRGEAGNSLMQMRTNMQAAIAGTSTVIGESAWDRSVADSSATGNPDMACIKNHSACANGVTALLNLKDRNGTEIFDARTTTRGFRLDGALCNTFSMAGDPSCPFRYDLVWKATCTDGSGVAVTAACVDPQIEVTGTFLYRPGPNEILGGKPLNQSQYNIKVRRGEGVATNIPIVFSYTINDSTQNGEGRCDLGSGAARMFNTVSDPTGLATFGANSFTLTQGRYECRVDAPAFKNGANTVTLKIAGLGGAVIASAKGIAAIQGGSTSITLQASMILTVPSTSFEVLHSCSNKPSDHGFGTGTNTWAMGVPVPMLGNYGSVTYTVVTCMKTG